MAADDPLHRVVALVLPGFLLLDLASAEHLFGYCGAGRYAWSVATLEPGPVPTATGGVLQVSQGLDAVAEADTVVVPGIRDVDASWPEPVFEALRAAYSRGARVVSICTGAFVLADAGLLDGRRATTHWWQCDDLAARRPEIEVVPDVLYVDEGRVLTSAGVAAGLDLCLHLVRRDHGAEVAAAFARRTVIAPHRDGGQAQFITRPIVPSDDGAGNGGAVSLAATRAWALEHLAEPLTVEVLARHAAVSPRTFARRFREETGTTPAAWIIEGRVSLARRLLERTELPVEAVAAQAGFGSAASLREHLGRRARTTPTAYRRAFRTAAPG